MEDKKYFVPNIEDFRVGYEYEYKTHNGINYSKEEFDKMEWQTGIYGFNDFPYVERTMKGRMQFQTIRVPYLTQEQIEAEGWTEYATEYKGEIRLENMNYLFFKEKSNFILVWFFNDNRISILVKDPSIEIDLKGNIIDYNDIPRYTGECKDINTFRYLCKLLKI